MIANRHSQPGTSRVADPRPAPAAADPATLSEAIATALATLGGQCGEDAADASDHRPGPRANARKSTANPAGSGGERLLVWSVVVTMFGDAAIPRGGVMRLSALQEVTDRLGLEPGALRTAMSRLARDGWLIRERRGRASYYAFTPEKRAELDIASRRIYAAGPPRWQGGWITLILHDRARNEARARGLAACGFGRVAAEVWMRPATDAPLDGFCDGGIEAALTEHASVLETPPGGARIAPALIARFWPAAAAARRLDDLIALAGVLERGLRRDPAPSPLDAMAARCLLIHQWRRAVLRDPDLPLALRPADWPGETARALVRDLYWRLVPASEAWLDLHADHGDFSAQAPAGEGLSQRFGGPPDRP